MKWRLSSHIPVGLQLSREIRFYANAGKVYLDASAGSTFARRPAGRLPDRVKICVQVMLARVPRSIDGTP